MRSVVFRSVNWHALSCGVPPDIENSDPDNYCGYFENEHGEQWVFFYDSESNLAQIWSGDCGWETPFEVRNGEVDDLILNEPERLWLAACWMAVTPSLQPIN